MRTAARTPGIFEGAGVAFAAALLGTGAMAVASSVLPAPVALRGVVAALGLGYLLYLLSLDRPRTGKPSLVLLWVAATAATLAIDPPLTVHLAVQLALVWLLRCVRVHRSVLPALLDLALAAGSAAAAAWAAQRTGSLFLVIWSSMLAQASFVLIPTRRAARRDGAGVDGDGRGGDDGRFTRAHRAAESALRRLSTAD